MGDAGDLCGEGVSGWTLDLNPNGVSRERVLVMVNGLGISCLTHGHLIASQPQLPNYPRSMIHPPAVPSLAAPATDGTLEVCPLFLVFSPPPPVVYNNGWNLPQVLLPWLAGRDEEVGGAVALRSISREGPLSWDFQPLSC